ncbi:MAG: peptidyl-prolyl cis-trans isomerase [gamma proteobacterium symbiont of Lucinoma myriamae]|nr:peptidyl-prolyl cis-trans isomerase [gamma proteobacterium symbiont of Lucinoma myriamae]MCU7819936.1 peptidyl-prolyl cis-trans isomerase [gamma proteobacterium symbiont of Lucinoma myriamae]MCU7832345.1 peptidyl-prolyl cis-trans isomerase [gamma proteobacterium symbiont of Lucinoma myriamae]
MTRFKFLVLSVFLISFSMLSFAADPVKIKMSTNKGDIILELYPDKAPETVKNFVNYAEINFYKKTIFHRVIGGFMIQGGGFTNAQDRKKTLSPIKNEADNGLKNDRGTIAMARTQDPNSATAQFFINLKNNDFLNHTRKSINGWGYTVFGKVTGGMDVVDKIASVKTQATAGQQNIPIDPIYIEDVTVIK